MKWYKKKLKTEFLNEDVAKKRLKEEFEILKKLAQHPNIIKVFEMKDEVSYTMQKAVSSLADITLNNEEEKVEVLLKILNGVKYIHSHDCIYRDLHSNNVLFLENGECVITDFGLAKDYTTQTLNTYSVQGPNHKYTAPEGLTNMKKLSVQSDIYSIGILMRDDLQLNSLISIINKATNSDPRYRYISIEELEKDIISVQNTINSEELSIEERLVDVVSFLELDTEYQCEILKKANVDETVIIDKYTEEDKLSNLFDIIDSKYLDSVGYNKWHEYDVYNNYNYKLIIHPEVNLLVKRKAYNNLKINHGNRFNNPINRIPVDIKLKLDTM